MSNRAIIERLRAEAVEFVIVGGIAMVLRGSSRTTIDLDICYARDNDNLERIARAIAPLQPSLRGAPPDLPFIWDAQTLRSGLNFTLRTREGDLDLLGEVTGLGGFDEVRKYSSEMELFGAPCSILDLDGLELSKRAAARAKDLLDLAEIQDIRRRS